MINVHDAKTNLSKLLRRVERGEEIIIARAGTPVARLVPCAAQPKRQPGEWAGRAWIADDFDATPEDLVARFESADDDPST